MFFEEKLLNFYRVMDVILFFIICILHFIFYFIIKQTNFETITDAYESSPLFNFYIDTTCGTDKHIIFHVWEGREETEYYYSNGRTRSRTKIYDKTEIDRINGYYFCYKHISYKDLLYNDQIKKKEEECKGYYPKDCGTIDTLEQHLCIKNNEKCPLYDIRIGEPENKNDYINEKSNSDIYYNNDNYNKPNKKIIGKLILNDGQPCYKLSEKLWRQFDSDEVSDTHLECQLSVFGVNTDDRYTNQGNIKYKKLYEILPRNSWDKLKFEKKIKDEYVSLYQREFLGIDKDCHLKSDINEGFYKNLRKNQQMEKNCLLAESIVFFIVIIFFLLIIKEVDRNVEEVVSKFIILFLITDIPFIICHSVFLVGIINNDSTYECSDKITNEYLRKETTYTKKSITYTAVNLGFDVFYIAINILGLLIALINRICEKIEDRLYEWEKKNNYEKNNYDNNNVNAQKIKVEPIREVVVDNAAPSLASLENKRKKK